MNKHTILFAAIALSTLSASAADFLKDGTTTVGAGVIVAPQYSGAKDYRAFPALFADYQASNGFFASTYRGLGYMGKADALSYSASVSYDAGRYDKKENVFSGSDDLKGMGRIKGAALANLGAGYDLGLAKVDFTAHMALTGRERGNTYEGGVNVPFSSSASDQVSFRGAATYGDRKNVQTFYGVTAAQAAASGYKAYTAKGGFESVAASVNWNHVIDAHWSVRTVAGLSHLVGDAAKSPLVKKTTAPILMSTVNYTF